MSSLPSSGWFALALFFYTMAAFGLAYVMGHSGISNPFRKLLAPDEGPTGEEYRQEHPWVYSFRLFATILIECPACSGFWYGAFTGAAIVWHYRSVPFWLPLVLALYTSGSNYLLGKLGGLIP